MLVDFIGDDEDVVSDAEVAYCEELGFCEDFTERVVSARQ